MDLRFLSLLLIVFASCTHKEQRDFSLPTTVTQEIERRISEGLNECISIGILNSDGSKRYFHFQDPEDTTELSEKSLFEIGSLTKTFTAYLAQEKLDSKHQTLGQIWPGKNLHASVAGTSWEELVNHTSGFPRLSISFDPDNWANPFQDYSTEKWEQELEELNLDTSSNWAYSNFGFATLGQAVSKVSHQSCEELMSDLLSEAGMKRTLLSHKDLEHKMELSPHHLDIPFDHWEFSGPSRFAGGLITCTQDLLSYMEFQRKCSPIFSGEDLENAVPTGIPYLNVEAGHLSHVQGWFLFQPDEDKSFLLHNGGTGGFTSFLAFDLQSQTAVVVLSNAMTLVDDLGLVILDSNISLLHPEPTAAMELAKDIHNQAEVDIQKRYEARATEGMQEDVLGIYWLERLYFGRKKYKTSGPLSQILVESIPNDWEAQFIRGQNLEAIKDYDQAIIHYQKASSLYPKHPLVDQAIERCYAQLN
jgi:CubicO group peptidase (beta-lactamase class C family)